MAKLKYPLFGHTFRIVSGGCVGRIPIGPPRSVDAHRRFLGRLSALIVISAMCSVLASCSSGSSSKSLAGASPTTCDRPAPPQNNVEAPADNCGVSAIEIDRNGSLPVDASLGQFRVELYIENAVACGVNGLNGNGSFCGVGDNRPFANVGRSDMADPSRNRVDATFDFRTGNATFRVNPSCSVPNGGGQTTCNPPHSDGDGNNVSVLHPSASTSEFQLQFVESAYPHLPFGLCTINEDLTFSVNRDTHSFVMTGNGSTFPSIAMAHQGSVVVADEGVHINGLCSPARQSYSYSFTSNVPSPSTSLPTSSLGTTQLSLNGFQYGIEVLDAHEDPNGVDATDTLSQPSLPPATPGTTYVVASIRIQNLQADRAAPLPDPSQFPVSIGASLAVFPPPNTTFINYCWAGNQSVPLAVFYPGDDPNECTQSVDAVVVRNSSQGNTYGSSIGPSSSADVTTYFSVPQTLPLSDFRILASQALKPTSAEYAAGVPLR